MPRLISLCFTTLLLASVGVAQEQVLASTPIYATYEAPPKTQQRTAAKADVFEKQPIEPIPSLPTNNYAVGNTPSSSGVSPTGAFTYSVPIAVPPGVNDAQPNIALSYNSQSGNGLAGWGWNISGLSTISRVGSTLHHDGVVDGVDFDALDRFALDGQRLVLTSGTYGKAGAVYTTENYSNIKITSQGTHTKGSTYGPRGFVVHYPDGSRAYYGNSEKAINRLEWVITKWEDSRGNQVNYTYDFSDIIKSAYGTIRISGTGGTLRVKSITYGNVDNTLVGEVKFYYKNRSRHENSYVGGIYASRKNILSNIEVKNRGVLFRKYQLTHHTTSMGYQRISQIQESIANGTKRAPVVFKYESSQTNTSITPHFLHQKNLPGVGSKTAVLTGNFNYDSNLDAVTYDVDRKNQLSIITGVTASGSGSIKIGHTFSVPKFKDIFSSTILLSGGNLLSQQGITTVKEEFSNEVSSTSFSTIVMAGIGPIIYSKKKWIAPTYTDYLCNDIPVYDRELKDYYPLRAVKREIPKAYVSGDFNGDGLTDVLAINKHYSITICDPPIPNCRHNLRTLSTSNQNANRYIEGVCDCHCENYSVNSGNTYFIDLDQRKKTDFAFRAGSIGSISSSDQLFAADYDGDGKTDLWHITDKKISVYTLINNRLERIVQFSDDWIKTDLQILKGDFNGDRKLDLLIPKQNNSKEWCFLYATGSSFHKITTTLPFEYKKSYINEYGYLNDYHFFTQDFNQDGKSDLIKHYVRSRDEPYGYYPDGSVKTEYYNYELFELFENKAYQNFEPTDFVEKVGHFYEKEKYLKNIKPIFAGINTQNKKMQYAILSGTTVKRYDISTPHRSNMQLRYVTKGGTRTKIDYAGLDATDYGSVYQADTGMQYPYININHAPGMELVKQLTETISGKTRYQQFKYKGAVSHAKGLGFMGFTALARSNTYGDNVSALWNISKHDPKLRGAATEQWTSESYAFNQNCYINKTVTGYRTELRPNKVFVNLPKHMATHNNITQVLHERFFTYDEYFNLDTEREKTKGLDKTTTYHYYNNPSPTDANYHIGRPRWEKTLSKVPGATDFWTETSYAYQNNLLRTEQQRANNSPWVSTTYGYDRFGNATSKTLATAGLSSRTESFGYSPDGRDMIWHKDVLGLTTSYEYFPNGALKKETDPYGNSTQYAYDGWNRLHKTTNYLGRVTEVTFKHLSNGGMVKTVNYPNTAPDTRTYYNAWGWADEKHTQVSNTQWSKVYFRYDILGRVTQESISDFNSPKKWNRTYYDLYGRISQVHQASGKVINTVYDGLRTQVSDGTKTATTTKNALDQMVELADPGGTIRYAYHANGELREADYGGYVVKTEIDSWGRKSKLIDPTAGTFTYKHNAFGELLEETAPKGKTVYAHDNYGRLKTKTWTGDLTDMVTTYTYNSQTKLLDYEQTTDNKNSTTHRINSEYDNYKRLKKLTETSTYANFSKDMYYDNYGRIFTELFSATDNTSKKRHQTNVIYTYDSTGRTNKIDHRGYSQHELWRSSTRNALGQTTRAQMGNGFVQNRTIDPFGFVTAISDRKGSATHQKALDLSYTFDVARGLLLSRSDKLLDIHNQRFAYDNMDRLTEAHRDTEGKTKTRTRGYDPRGRLTQDSFMGVHLTYGNGNDRYRLTGAELNPNGTAYYNKHKDRKITYNADRKPVDVHDVGNGRITFNYSHDGHRQEVWYGGENETKTERNYHKTYSRIAPMELVRDLDNDTQKFLTYVGGDAYTAPVVHVKDTDSSKPNGYHYLHRDYLGSILAVSNSAGSVIERAHFGAWGDVAVVSDPSTSSGSSSAEPIEVHTGEKAAIAFADTLTGRGFTGHEHFSEVDLIHMNGRMYDAQQGRFLSPDNHIQDPFNTQNFNRYGYVLNNPLSLTDPSGEFFWVAVAIGAFFGGASAAMQGGDFWDILGGALIGGIAGGIGAGVSNLAAGALGLSSTGGAAAGFFGNAALSAAGAGFNVAFQVAFAGGFAAGFVGAAGNALMKGQKFGKSLVMGLKAGFFSGVAAGITAGVGAGFRAKKAGRNFWTGKRPELKTISTLQPKGIEGLELPEIKGGDLSGLQPRPNVLNSPVGDAPITSPFNVERSVGTSPHIGTDYGVSTGTPVRATANGIVERVYQSDTLGNTVILNHGQSPQGGNVYSLYAHGNSTTVVQGQSVSVGQNIMFSGNTGSASLGAHLHYEVIKTTHSPFTQQFFGNIGERYAPSSLSNLLRY